MFVNLLCICEYQWIVKALLFCLPVVDMLGLSERSLGDVIRKKRSAAPLHTGIVPWSVLVEKTHEMTTLRLSCIPHSGENKTTVFIETEEISGRMRKQETWACRINRAEHMGTQNK